jgi:hypothetical protein
VEWIGRLRAGADRSGQDECYDDSTHHGAFSWLRRQATLRSLDIDGFLIDGTQRRYDDGVVLANLIMAAIVAATPGSASGTDLHFFVGSWDCSGTFPASGRAISSTLHFEEDLAGRGLTMTQDDKPPNAYHAGGLWGPSADGKSLIVAIEDVTGSVRRFSSSGWQNGELMLQSDERVTPAQQFVYDRVTEDSMRITWKAERDGGYRVGDVLNCTRSGSA